MIEASHWHPVARVEDLAQQPLAVIVLAQPVVLWRDAAGVVRAWADQCPHRGAKLSLGRVQGDRLECAYHGWQFAPTGECVTVPALPAFKPPPSHCARVYQACESYGLIWVRLTSAIAAPATACGADVTGLPLARFGAEHDAQLRKLNCGPYDVATSAPRIIENFLDMAHFGFVHEGGLGTREMTAIDDYQVKTTEHGLLATQCRAWQPQSNLHSTQVAQVEYSYEVTGPYSAVLTKVPDPASMGQAVGRPKGAGKAVRPAELQQAEPYRESIALFICPVGPESSRVWFRLAVADFKSSDAKLRKFQHTIFMQDKPILESQCPKRLPLDVRTELHTAADKASSAYRRHLKKLGITFGVC